MKSFIRAIKRDYKNKYFLDLEKKKHKYLYKLTRLFKITKRRTSVFKQKKEIEEIINYFEKMLNYIKMTSVVDKFQMLIGSAQPK